MKPETDDTRKGNCFELNLELFMEFALHVHHLILEDPFGVEELDPIDASRFRLVHGCPIGTGDHNRGKRFFHCWVEIDGHNTLLDASKPGEVNHFIKDVYYAVGQIEEEWVRRYTPAQVAEFVFNHETTGPWDPIFLEMAERGEVL